MYNSRLAVPAGREDGPQAPVPRRGSLAHREQRLRGDAPGSRALPLQAPLPAATADRVVEQDARRPRRRGQGLAGQSAGHVGGDRQHEAVARPLPRDRQRRERQGHAHAQSQPSAGGETIFKYMYITQPRTRKWTKKALRPQLRT